MDGYVCTVGGGKGGVGKTTITLNMGAVIADRGYDVVVVDADLRMANLATFLGIEPDTSIHDVLCEDATVAEAVVETPRGLTVVAGEQSLDAFADADPANLSTAIRTLGEEYDIVLVDTGAGVSHDVAVAVGHANGVLLVTTPEDAAIGDTSKTATLADRVDGTVLGTVINRARSESAVDETADEMAGRILGVIPEDPPATDRELLTWHAPESDAAVAVRDLADSLLAVWFEDESVDALDPVYDEAWFADESDTEDSATEADDAVDRDDEVFGLFN